MAAINMGLIVTLCPNSHLLRGQIEARLANVPPHHPTSD
jgi:hypothetical protein